MLNRVIATSVAVPLAVYSGEMWVASQGRGGRFALAIACILTASIALLLWTATFGGPSTIQARRLWRAHLISVAEDLGAAPQSEDLLLLDDAMSRLERADPRAAKVVELRFFGGLHEQEVADILGVSIVTVKRDWKVARAWLIDQLQSSQ